MVASAIQDLVVTRLGRGFLPLAGLFAAGLVASFASAGHGWWTAVGALAAAGVMLLYGLSIVEGARGRPRRSWMIATGVVAFVPPLYGVYVLGWLGLRSFTTLDGVPSLVRATLYVILGVWVLRAWLRVVEVRRLARVMASNTDGEGSWE